MSLAYRLHVVGEFCVHKIKQVELKTQLITQFRYKKNYVYIGKVKEFSSLTFETNAARAEFNESLSWLIVNYRCVAFF